MLKLKVKRKRRKLPKGVYRKGGKYYYQNGGEYTFESAGGSNDMTIKGNNKYSTGNYNEFNRESFDQVTSAVSSGLGTVGDAVSAMGRNPDGSLERDVYTGGEVAKGTAKGLQYTQGMGPIVQAIGAGVGAIGGGIYGAVNSDKVNREVAEAAFAKAQRERDRIQARSQAILADYPTEGVIGNELYQKYGGKIPYAKGGHIADNGMPPVLNQGGVLEQTSSNTSTADGAEHEQGGIELPQAEIENDEVLQNTGNNNINVFSDKLMHKPGVTYAKEADRISRKKGALEKRLESGSIYVQNSAKRMIANLDNELDTLHQKQEDSKGPNPDTNPQYLAEGGSIYGDGRYKKNYATGIERALPFADNVVNAILTDKMPEIPEPVQTEAMPLKTKFNIAPQLAESKRQQANLVNTLERNTASSTDFRNQAIASKLAGDVNTNKLYGQKENYETQMINRNRLNVQGIDAINVQKENQYNMQKMHRIDDQHQRISRNVANASTDAQMQVAEQNRYELDLAKMDLLKARYKETGVWDRNIESTIEQHLKGNTTDKEFVKTMKSFGKEAGKLAEQIFKGSKRSILKSKAKKGRKKAIEDEEQEIVKKSILLDSDMIMPPDKRYNPSAIRQGTLSDIEEYEKGKKQRKAKKKARNRGAYTKQLFGRPGEF